MLGSGEDITASLVQPGNNDALPIDGRRLQRTKMCDPDRPNQNPNHECDANQTSIYAGEQDTQPSHLHLHFASSPSLALHIYARHRN